MKTKEHKIKEFNEKLAIKEKNLLNKMNQLKEKHPNIKKALDEIDNYGFYACINSDKIKKEDFEKKTKELNTNLIKELEKEGYEKNYLEIDYDCPICKDKGYVDGKMCSCLKEFLKKSNSSHPIMMRRGSFDDFNEKLFSENKGNYKISPRENILNNKNQALKFINEFNENTNIKGLLMLGTVGSGKTFLAAATGKMILEKGFDVICLTSSEFENIIKSFQDPSFEKNKQELFDCDLIIIDDLGIETQSEYVNNELLKLIDYRITYNKKMIITTNLSLNEIMEKYKTRIYSRIVSNFKYLLFYGDDIRISSKLKK